VSRARQVWLVARRELLERGRSRGFLLSLLLTTGLIVAGAVAPILLFGDEGPLRVGVAETLARQFDRVLSVLRHLGYVDGWSLSDKGRTLSRIYGEGDILVAEALDRGIFDGLEPEEVAALLSSVVYEGRERVPLSGHMPTPATRERYDLLQRTWRTIRRTEDEHQVQLCRELESGFAGPIFHWAQGRPLDEVLAETEMAPGDFVRNCKQILDLLRQVQEVAKPETAALFARSRSSVLRGVVAYTGV